MMEKFVSNPNTGSGDRESSIADGWQPSTADNKQWWRGGS